MEIRISSHSAMEISFQQHVGLNFLILVGTCRKNVDCIDGFIKYTGKSVDEIYVICLQINYIDIGKAMLGIS